MSALKRPASSWLSVVASGGLGMLPSRGGIKVMGGGVKQWWYYWLGGLDRRGLKSSGEGWWTGSVVVHGGVD